MLIRTLMILVASLALFACRGGTSTSPPVHLVLDMDFQPKLKAQSASAFDGWADGRAMRLPVTDSQNRVSVVAHGSLPDPILMPDPNKAGKNVDGTWLKNPLPLTNEVLERGRERFDINCSVCHGYSGQGGNGAQAHGMVGRRWPVVIPNFHVVEGKDNRVANLTDGEIFEVLSSPVGKNTMPSYAARITVKDRWAIIHYVRALQTLGKQ
ncbi:MAG: cytochrome c [Planctomycetes bacterium]|nr:cytochrome c [Planctomycetota bacterium]